MTVAPMVRQASPPSSCYVVELHLLSTEAVDLATSRLAEAVTRAATLRAGRHPMVPRRAVFIGGLLAGSTAASRARPPPSSSPACSIAMAAACGAYLTTDQQCLKCTGLHQASLHKAGCSGPDLAGYCKRAGQLQCGVASSAFTSCNACVQSAVATEALDFWWSWGTNSSLQPTLPAQAYEQAMRTFIPMLWGEGRPADAAYSFLQSGSQFVMGFNEPDQYGPACDGDWPLPEFGCLKGEWRAATSSGWAPLFDPTAGKPSCRRDCHSAAPPSTFSRCFNSDGERASAK